MFAEQASEPSALAGAGCIMVAVSYATSERLLRINQLASSLPAPLPSGLAARGEQWHSGSVDRAIKREQAGRVCLSRGYSHVGLLINFAKRTI
jgi:hypothetical protein